MKRLNLFLGVFWLGWGGLPLPVAAQSVQQLFHDGQHQEEIIGDLQAAIDRYQKVVDQHAQNRHTAARALYRIGGCYEKLGQNGQAISAYQRQLRNFADQIDTAAQARKRLAALGVPRGQIAADSEVNYRLVVEAGHLNEHSTFNAPFDFSPDGRHLVFAAQAPADTFAVRLYLSDHSGTVIRPLLAAADQWKMYVAPRWSPDGRRIAYWAVRDSVEAAGKLRAQTALFVVEADGTGPRQLIPPLLLTRGLTPPDLCWSPDGGQLTYAQRQEPAPGFHTLAFDGSAVGFIPFEMPRFVQLGGYSPDGRWLAVQMNATAVHNMDLWLIPAVGGPPRRLTQASDYEGHPVWAADGRSIYFVAGASQHFQLERSGTSNVWKLAIDLQTGQAQGAPEQVTFYRDALLTHPRILGLGRRLGYVLKKTMHIVHVADNHVADKTWPQDARSLVRGLAPQLSPDGQTVFYLGEGEEEDGIYAVPASGGLPRCLVQGDIKGFGLAPDGGELAYFSDSVNGAKLWVLPAAGGEPRQVLALGPQLPEDILIPRWSPDSRRLAYATSYTAGNGLYVLDPAAGSPQALAHLKGRWHTDTLCWSPDGRHIAGLGFTDQAGGTNTVFVVPAAGGPLRQLTPSDEGKAGLAWHPDGQRLTYHVMPKGNGENRQVYLDGRPPELLLDQPDAWDFVGTWAPNGRQFFFNSQNPKFTDLFVYNVESGDFNLFATQVAMAELPSFSRDGEKVVWVGEKKLTQIWIMENFK